MDSRLDYDQIAHLYASQHISNLSIIDEEFVYKVQHDIERFVLRRPNQSVLLFPPVNNFRRFLIHQTCESLSQKYDLCTFSVGQGANRRTVVTFKSQLLQTQNFNESVIDCKRGTNIRNNIKTANMGVKRQTSDVRLNKTNEINLYRPPALRNNLQTSNNDLMNMNENKTSTTTAAATTTTTKSGILHTTLTTVQSNLLPTKNQNGATKNNSMTLMANMKKYKLQQQQQLVYSQTAAEISNEMATSAITTTTTNKQTLTNCPSESINQTKESMKQQPQSQPQHHQQATVRRERRPDRAVYIPRARRSQTTPPSSTTTATTTTTTTADNISNPTTIQKSSTKNSNGNRNDIKTTTTTTTQTQKKNHHTQLLNELTFEQEEEEAKQFDENDKRKIQLNQLREEEEKDSEKVQEKENEFLNIFNSAIQPIINDCDNAKSVQQQQQQQHQLIEEEEENKRLLNENLFVVDLETEIECNIVTKRTDVDENFMHIEEEEDKKLLKSSDNNNTINNNNMSLNQKSHEIEENIEEQELKRASKEMNRSNRRINKQTFVSDVLEIPDQLPNSKINHHIINNHVESQAEEQQQNSNKKDINEATTDEDDWDAMYDESGACLDAKITQEITNAVGKVKLDLPEMDYSMYLSKQKLLEKESFPHVLEVSNFPAEFKHQDLLMVFSQYKESGFDIKWVDDTHALAVFSSARIAAEVLTMGHPFVVLKTLSDAKPESRAKAKKCATSLQPYRPRPETCAALARRLVTGALGVRLKTAAEEREKEKRVLKEAKERKLMAAKQRDETWDN